MQIYKFNPYPNEYLNCVDQVTLWLMRPLRYSLDQLLSCFQPTTKELKRPHVVIATSLIGVPVYLVLALLFLIPAVLGFLLLVPICSQRSSFRVSVSDISPESREYIKSNEHYAKFLKSKTESRMKTGASNLLQTTFRVATLNVCFLQEFLSRYNNLGDTHKRAYSVGERLLKNQMKFVRNNQDEIINGNVKELQDDMKTANSRYHNDTQSLDNDSHNYSIHKITVNNIEVEVDVTVLTEFPSTDFLVFQETWDTKLAEVLASHLHRVYPYIVYDVGDEGWKENHYCNNSALMVASKWPISHIRFSRFQRRYLHDHLSSKGLLQVKVDLGSRGKKRQVGLLYNTHLQVYPGRNPSRLLQMDDIIQWTRQFRSDVVADDESVSFEILVGDLNFDNSSPVDKDDYSHALFDEFKDIWRVKAGVEQPFVIGTDVRHIPLYDDLVSTPEGMKMALDDPVLKQFYLTDGNQETEVCADTSRRMTQLDAAGNVIPHPQGGRRRLDYILFKECDKVKPVAINHVTLLAGLTDHVPVTMTFNINSF